MFHDHLTIRIQIIRDDLFISGIRTLTECYGVSVFVAIAALAISRGFSRGSIRMDAGPQVIFSSNIFSDAGMVTTLWPFEEVALPALDFPSAPVQVPAGCRGNGAASVHVAV